MQSSTFFRQEAGWTILFALIHVLFWSSTYPIMEEYGYSDKKSPTGAYVSGPKGSGIVPVTLTVLIIFSVVWLTKVVKAIRLTFAAKEN